MDSSDRTPSGTEPGSVFAGVGVALVTLFDDDGRLDSPATAAHAARLVEAGVAAVVIAGTTGEAAALDPEERSTLFRAVRHAIGDQVPMIAGTGAPSARQAVALSRRAADNGADGLLVLSPPTVADPRPYYEQVSSSVQAPVLAYHYPGVSSPGVPIETLRDLPVVGLKDSSGDAERLILESHQLSTGLYVGNPALVNLAGSIGCTGAILALANLDPEGCLRAWSDPSAQRDLLKAHQTDTSQGIAGIKRALHRLHGTGHFTRIG
jgi:4-hydroxy-tetrahydrodipicolinate synthase